MRAALVKIIRGDVENIIVADGALDYPPKGYALIPLPEDSPIGVGYQWDEKVDFLPPQKFVGVTNGKVSKVVTVRAFDPEPVLEKCDETLRVEHDQAVEVDFIANKDGTFSTPTKD